MKEIEYVLINDTDYRTTCHYFTDTMIGSYNCSECYYFVSKNHRKRTVMCSLPGEGDVIRVKPDNDKMIDRMVLDDIKLKNGLFTIKEYNMDYIKVYTGANNCGYWVMYCELYHLEIQRDFIHRTDLPNELFKI